ncbi:LmeA family phospholipid-binding protein [Chroococcidiopsis sp.]|uniref:LmeA family phospholipid-binding protein n=1 Tax=Chroococcidiopsis sp. TaxID=3088168 RepID=UPI003F31F90F
MFSSLTSLTNPMGSDWGERLLNTVANKTIRYLFTQSESVEVSIHCYPSSKLLQGSIDSFKMSGRGLVIRHEFRAEEMTLITDAIAIDFSSLLRGKLALAQPTQAIVRVTLSEAGIDRAFEAEVVKKRLQNLYLPALSDISGGNSVSFEAVRLQLLPNNRVQIWANADLSNGKLVPISLSATITIERRRRLAFCEPKFEADSVPESQREISQTLSIILVEILDRMVDLDRFDLDGITIRLNQLETQEKLLIFSGYAQIERIPANS